MNTGDDVGEAGGVYDRTTEEGTVNTLNHNGGVVEAKTGPIGPKQDNDVALQANDADDDDDDGDDGSAGHASDGGYDRTTERGTSNTPNYSGTVIEKNAGSATTSPRAGNDVVAGRGGASGDGGYDRTTDEGTSNTPNYGAGVAATNPNPAHLKPGNGVDHGAAHDDVAGETPFVLAKQAMQRFLNHHRDGHSDWDATSVLAQAGEVAKQFKVRKTLLGQWTRGQLDILKALRARTTKPLPDIDDKAAPGQSDKKRRKAETGSTGETGEERDPLAAFDRATAEMCSYIERYEAGDLARESVLAAVPVIAARHGVLSSDLRAWTRAELKKLEDPSDKSGSKVDDTPTISPSLPTPKAHPSPVPLANALDFIARMTHERVVCSDAVADATALWSTATWGGTIPMQWTCSPVLVSARRRSDAASRYFWRRSSTSPPSRCHRRVSVHHHCSASPRRGNPPGASTKPTSLPTAIRI
jgi:hypothetical protein